MGEGAGADAGIACSSGSGGNEPNGPCGAKVEKLNMFARMGAGMMKGMVECLVWEEELLTMYKSARAT